MNKIVKYFFLYIFIFLSFGLGAFFYLFNYDFVDFDKAFNESQSKPSIVLDDNNEILFTFKLDKKEPASYRDFSKNLVDAFVAAEDWNFFSHNGISWRGILRSFFVNLRHFKIVQGASTITQQVAKLLFLSQERTLFRKFKDIFLSLQIEQKYTKEQILELYLNNVYFGRGIYGVQAAAQRFWGKSIQELSLDECATLAATAKSAKFYSPLNCLERSYRRRNLVLNNMYKLNFISKNNFNYFINKNLNINKLYNSDNTLLYIQEYIRSLAESTFGKDALYTQGLVIKTTINKYKQELASKIFREKLKIIRKNLDEKLNGGMIAIESDTGKIKALVGGFDFNESQFNRVLQAKRQIGSAFKPFLYASALKTGLDMDDIFVDEPISIELPNNNIYSPKNWDNKFSGQMTLLKALTISNNIIAVKLLLTLGYDHVIKWAKKFQINSDFKPYPSLALGTAELTVKDLATSFNTFANNGIYVSSYFIESVKDCNNKKIWQFKNKKIKVLDSISNSKMVNALSYRIKKAQESLHYNKWIDAQAFGKTGSTNDATSTWFVGSTPELTTCVYIGRDDNKPVGKNIFASSTVFPIWLLFNINLKFDKKIFYLDPSLHEYAINWNDGKKTGEYDSNTVIILK
ncbi:MAG: Membrane carboxypeptidase [candidate division TM6 bacterium GW2011_GWF2_28_16]|nr:MAG: Membrane carboxypeptidase [candidate division TM6 bacterium GW2011_GWF2_28_16]